MKKKNLFKSTKNKFNFNLNISEFIEKPTPYHKKSEKIVKKYPRIVQKLIQKLKHGTRRAKNEKGFTVYFRGKEYYIQKDYGVGCLTVSDFSKLTPDKVIFVAQPTEVYLLHTHPFSAYPYPSFLDLDTAKRFRDYYKNARVHCVVIGRKSIYIY
ncbi:MAG: hypothetical protein J7K83_04040 [Candidatus Aenigmarchaeota archaeon]|nr:hypothetical protein [Candidatus Aenigmarchaeota archaeon]